MSVAVACVALLAGAALARPAAAAETPPANVLVLEGDGAIFKAPTPFPFAGRRIRFEPSASGGYTTRVERAEEVVARGKWLRFEAGADEREAPVRIELTQPIQLFDQGHREMFVHPHGAVSLSEPLPPGTAARASESGELLRTLASGPAFVAGLWNELLPDRAPTGGGVYVAQWPDRVMVTWVQVPSVRPSGEPNTFRIVFHRDGRVDLEYGEMHSAWGIVGLSPAATRERVAITDFAAAPVLAPNEAALTWYRDLPVLDEVEVSRRAFEKIPDRFQFLTVFTTQPVDGPHLVGSTSVKNDIAGIGMPIFDHGSLFGARRLEHMVLMNDLAFYADDPRDAPNADGYSYAPSTLAVLAHEAGHRWLSHVHEPLPLSSGDGHWSFFLESGGSLMGGHRLRTNPDGSFTATRAMSGFGPLDLYLMGLIPAASVKPFFLVEDVASASGDRGVQVTPTPHSRPQPGTTFSGARRDVTVSDVIASVGVRAPSSEDSPHTFKMAFVLVVPPGSVASAEEIAKVDRVRQAFGSFFRRATGGRARMMTRIPAAGAEAELPQPTAPLDAAPGGEPLVLDVSVQSGADGSEAMVVDFADADADVVTLELSTDVSADLPPAAIDVASDVYGARRGSISFRLAELPEGAAELRLALVDAGGRRSTTIVHAVTSRAS